jgi:hypothetical protein
MSKAYSFPEAWTENEALLRKLLTVDTQTETSASKLQRVLVSDPKLLSVFQVPGAQEDDPVPFTWEWLGLKFAEGIVSGAAGWAISTMLDFLRGPQTILLHEKALLAIRDLVQEAIDAAFLNHYMGEVVAIREQLLVYADTNDAARLNSALDRGFPLVHQLRGLHIKGLGGFTMAANLHLAAMRAKSETDPAYRVSFDRVRVEYAGFGVELANAARDRLEQRVGPCQCHRTNPPREPKETSCIFEYDWGKEKRLFGPDENDSKVRNECSESRHGYYRTLTIEPIQTQINPMVEVFRQWAP